MIHHYYNVSSDTVLLAPKDFISKQNQPFFNDKTIFQVY